jgi:hypothetical protein
MQLSTADDPILPTEAKFNVRVLEEAIDRVEDEVKCEHRFRDPHQYKWERVQHVLERFLQWVESANVEPVKLGRGVVYGVQAPKWFPLVASHV